MKSAVELWRRRLTGPAVILLAAAVATAPILLHRSYCGDDFEFHAVGWFDVQQSWLHGVVYPHWMASANYGAGEPRFMFYPPLTWMLGAALGFVLPWVLVPVAMVFLFLAGTGLAVRRLALERLTDASATLAGCAALFSGFALFTAYERTAFAELTGGFWMPLILLFALRGVETKPTRVLNGSTVPLALLLAGAWLSNGPVGVMASYLLAAMAVGAAVWSLSWKPLVRGGIASALGIGLAGFSLIPAAWEQRWADLRAAVDYPVFRIENNWLFARPADPALAPFRAVLLRASTIAAEMIGVALICAAIVLWRQIKEKHEASGRQEASGHEKASGKHEVSGHDFSRAAKAPKTNQSSAPATGMRDASLQRWWIFLALIPAVVLFLQFPVSLPVWNLLPKLRFLQYPWRWLLAVEAPMGVFFAAAVWPPPTAKAGRRIAVVCLCALLFLGTTAYAERTFLRACREGDSIADLLLLFRSGGTEGTDEYEPPDADHWLLPKGLPDGCLSDTADVNLAPNRTAVDGVPPSIEWRSSQGGCLRTFTAADRGAGHMRFDLDVPRAGFLILRLMRYPAWRVTVNGNHPGPLPERDDGLIAVPVPQGPVELRVNWVATPDVVAARWVSGLSVGLLLCILWLESQTGYVSRNASKAFGKTL
jgi:hypothetical protein